MMETIELKFLLPDELAIFNDAKTKAFQTTTQTPFSESLTPLSSKNLEFSVESDCKNGNLELDERGSFTYTSKENFVGVDSFIYIIKANGEKSAPKVVNITVNLSNAPVAPIIAEIKEPVSDLNQTKEKVVAVEEEIKEEVKKVTEKTPEERAKEEERYQKFKYYVEEQELTTEKMEKLQKTYPDLFGRLLKEKTSGL
jgi:ferritin